jgi:hypothetical protein
MKTKYLLFAISFLLPLSMQAQGGPGGGGQSSGTTIGSVSSTGYSQSSGSITVSGKTYTSTGSDENAVQVTGGTFSMTDCTVTKTGDYSASSDNTSFYGVNSAVYVGGSSATTLTMTGGTITTNAKGANAAFAYSKGVLNISDVTIRNTSNLSRGIHATGGGTINATNLDITTAGSNSSVIATDKGGGTVTVNKGSYVTTGTDCAVLYSTGTISITDATGSSSKGEVGVIEGNNTIAITDCNMTSGSSTRGLMILQSGSGDSEGYNGKITISGSTITLTDTSAPLLEVPTNITGTLTLDNTSLTVPSGVLMKVDYNTRWSTKGGTGNLILENGNYTGAVYADSYGTANVTVESTAIWTGDIDNTNVASSTAVTVNGKWILDADSYVDNLVIANCATVYTNGHNLTYGSITNNGTLDTSSTNVTGISSVSTSASSVTGNVYTLDGVLVQRNASDLSLLAPNIYILNGKKYIKR